MMKCKFKNAFMIGLLVFLMGTVASGEELHTEEMDMDNLNSYQYAITPEDENWFDFTVKERVKLCRIPENVLKHMTNEQLAQAVVNYPFLCDVVLYDTLETGVKEIEKICDAYVELVSREGGKEALLEMIQARGIMATLAAVPNSERAKNNYLVALVTYQEQFKDEITERDTEIMAQVSSLANKWDVPFNTSRLNINTPNGYPIINHPGYCSSTASHQAEHTADDETIIATYGVELVSPGTCNYNCHSYAWYNQDKDSNGYVTNTTIIENPAPYMLDGSYVKYPHSIHNASSLSIWPGVKIFYGTLTNTSNINLAGVSQNSHSAIIDDEPSNVPLKNRMAVSKWGNSGLFRHTVMNVPNGYDAIPETNDLQPYDIDNISAWYYPQ